MRILLVDDDQTLVDLLTRNLGQQNYAVDAATDGEQGWIYGSTYDYDLMILDWSLPKLDGISLCQRFRAHGYANPIILLTSRDGSQNKIKGLDAGADDYICKPVDLEELAARIRTLLRRVNCNFFPVLTWGKLQLNPCNCTVTYQGQPLFLGAKEYRLLELFLRHSKEVLSIEEIIDHLWSANEYPAAATVRSHLRRLRQKLQQAGLPEDLIITIRRQGYALKPLGEKTDEDQSEDPSIVPHQQTISQTKIQDKKAKQIEALTAIWEKYRPKREQQLVSLEQAVTALQTGNLTTSDRVSAIVVAHSLKGTLGQFGLERAAHLATEIEQLLQKASSQNFSLLQQLSSKLQALREELRINQGISPQLSQKIAKNTPSLLIVNDNEDFTEQLRLEAQIQGMTTKIIPTPRLVKTWLAQTQAREEQLPDVVLLHISFTEETTVSDARSEYLALIAEFNLLVPSIPVIVIADRDRFQDRLQVTRHGGKFYLPQPMSPSQIISVCQQASQHFSLGKKIMIVDDDVELLQMLPSLLEPWGFQLTTLDDPRQFWDVLQAVEPDLLVLDIEMPHCSGIELCKVLRTHSYWSQLPVLFLSAHTDVTIFNQVLASGANDFVNKPVIAQELADRILNRLTIATN